VKNWKTKVLSTALVLAVMVPTASFASGAGSAAKDLNPGMKAHAQHQRLNAEQLQAAKDKVLDLVSEYTPESLNEWEDALTEREQLMSELKEKAPALKNRPELSDEVKEKMETIREKVENGEITREEARQELQDLGFGKRFDRDQKPQLSDEVKAKLETIREKVENGTLTREQAREKLQELGLDKQFAGTPWFALQKAVEADDDAKIKELLPQMLEQLKERNQKISSKLQTN